VHSISRGRCRACSSGYRHLQRHSDGKERDFRTTPFIPQPADDCSCAGCCGSDGLASMQEAPCLGRAEHLAFVATHASAVAATLIWVVIEWLHRGKPTMFGAATGSIAGLATITRLPAL